MSTSIVGNPAYTSLIGNTWLATANRISQLVTGSIPIESAYNEPLVGGSVSFSFAYSSSNLTVNDLQRQVEDIQTGFSAMNASGTALNLISTRIDIMDGLAQQIKNNPDLTDNQINNINSQINFSLQEIYEIAQTYTYNGVPVLSGEIESLGVYIELTNNMSIDITKAFSSANPEDLGLPRQGEAYVNSSNVNDFLDQVSDARNTVENQISLIDSYSTDLYDALNVINDAIYDSNLFSLSTTSIPYSPGITKPYGYLNEDLYLTYNAISNNIIENNYYVDTILGLVN
ncbi:MAG: hypothetical protein AB1782_11285 [Cyanobacteriota bacterium]